MYEGIIHDLARYLGALYRVENSSVEAIRYNGILYTWDEGLGLHGSNWVNGGNTLVSVIVSDFISNPLMNDVEFVLVDIYDREFSLNITFDINFDLNTLLYNTYTATSYEYTDYSYNYFDIELVGSTLMVLYDEEDLIEYNSSNIYEGVMHDLARYLGALYRTENSIISSLRYNDVIYTWDEILSLHGSNWQNDGTTLVSQIVNDFAPVPGVNTLSIDIINQYGGEISFNIEFSIQFDIIV